MYIYVSNDSNEYYRNCDANKQNNNYKEYEIDSIPNETDKVKIQFYKLIKTLKPIERITHYYDKNSNEINVQKQYIPNYIYSWELDENTYNEYIKTSEYKPVKTNQELQVENRELREIIDKQSSDLTDLQAMVVDLSLQMI